MYINMNRQARVIMGSFLTSFPMGGSVEDVCELVCKGADCITPNILFEDWDSTFLGNFIEDLIDDLKEEK